MSDTTKVEFPEVSASVRAFAREFGQLCARHNVGSASCGIRHSVMGDLREHGDAEITWREGRHGAEAGRVHVRVQLHLDETFEYDHREFVNAREHAR